jgi:microcystin-dependent protein
LAISNHAAGTCTKTGGVTDCAAFDTETTGSDVGHSNMQPYLTITHIIYAGV